MMRIFHLMLMLLWLAVAPSCRAQQAPGVVLRATAVAGGAMATLGELAEIHGGTAAQQASLAALAVVPAPQPGYTSGVTLAQVQRLLRARDGMSTVRVGGAQAVRIERAAAALPPAQAQQAALAYVQRELGAAGYAVTARADGAAPAMQVPAGKVTLAPVALAPAQMLRPRLVVRLDVLVDGVQFGVLGVPLALEARATVRQARRDLRAGEVLACADTETVVADMARLGAEAADADCRDGAWRLRTMLPRGEVLLARMVDPAPAVVRGQQVRLRVASGAIELESAALALADGQIGQRIAVRASHSKEEVLAEITSPGNVMVLRR
jgi:flagella basal body P-ring formation protein FlgA